MTQSRRGLKSLNIQLALGVALGACVMLAVVLFADMGSVVREARKIEPKYLLAACALSLVNYCVRFTKWHFFLRRLGLEVPLGESFLTFMSGLSMSVTPGKLGELLKAFMLKVTRGIPVAKTSPVVITERATDAFGLVVLMALGSLSFSYGKAALVVVATTSVALVLLVQQRRLVEAALERLERVARLSNLVPQVRIFYNASYELFRPASLVPTTLVSAASWGMEGFAFYLILVGLGTHLALSKTVFIFSFSTLIGAISMLPGGLGAADGSLLGLLTLEGISKARAGSAALIVRLATLWLAVAVGVVALAVSVRVGLIKGGLRGLGEAAQASPAQGIAESKSSPHRPA